RDDPAARALAVPLHLDQPGALAGEASGVGAVGAVDRHAPAPGDEADDLVAGHRRAAARQPHQHVVEPFDVDADLGVRPPGLAPGAGGGGGDLLLAAPHL